LPANPMAYNTNIYLGWYECSRINQ
jgi:hypothetical protein